MAKPKSEDAPDDLIGRVLASLDGAKSGVWSSMSEGIKRSEPKFYLPMGITLLDAELGGGLPVGRIIEMIGEESTSKTLLGLNCLAKARDLGWIPCFLDTECAPGVDFATRLGRIKPSEVIYGQAYTIEAAGNAITEMITRIRGGMLKAKKTDAGGETKPKLIEGTAPIAKGGPPIITLWDSYAGLPSREEKALGLDQYAAMGRRAYKMKLWCMDEVQRFGEEQVLIIITNHVTAKLNSTNKYDTKTSPGGSALRHFPSVRILFTQFGPPIKKPGIDDPLGVWIRATLLKTRFGPCYRKVEFPVYYDHGIDDHEHVLQYLWGRGALGAKAGYGEWQEKHYRREQYLDMMRADAAMFAQLQDRAKKLYKGEPPARPETPAELAEAEIPVMDEDGPPDD